MICPKCAVENEDTSQYCSSCSTQLHGSNAHVSQQYTIYAGFWRRFVATIIDAIILTFGGLILGGIVGFIIGLVMGLSGIDTNTIKATASVMGYILGIVLNWLYYTLLESSSKQATIGKMAIGIKVTGLNGGKISFGKANGRYWGKIISALIILVGFIMAGVTEKKQALHDTMAGTLVIMK